MKQKREQMPNHSGISPVMLDLLVDGELSETERRELLLRLDEVPDGWRRCAIAFLESQCWHECFHRDLPSDGDLLASALFSEIADSSKETRPEAVPLSNVSDSKSRKPSVQVDSATKPTPPTSSSRLRKWKTPVAMAAGFLLALFLGFLMKEGMNLSPTGPNDTTIAETESRNGMPDSLQNKNSAIDGGDYATGPFGPDPVEASVDPWSQVTLKSPENGGQEFQIPCYEAKTFPPTGRHDFATLFGPEDFHLPRLPYDTSRSEKYPRMMISLGNGRYLVVPIDHLEIDYAPVSSRE